MKKTYLATLLSLTSLLSFNIFAETQSIANNTNSSPEMKHLNVGIGSYASTINVDGRYGDEDLEFSGFSFSGSYNLNDNVAFRASYYSLEWDESSELESSGFDILAYYGTGLATEGFKAYIGGGLFTDTWEGDGEEEDFSGLQLSGGIGYNWEVVALDLIVGIRSADDYADMIEDFGGEGDVTAVSASFVVSARF